MKVMTQDDMKNAIANEIKKQIDYEKKKIPLYMEHGVKAHIE